MMTNSSTPARDLPTVAVGAVIWNARGEVLLVRRAGDPRRDEWSIPGGKVEWGESLRAALTREVREETGLEIEILGLIDAVDFLAPGAGSDVAKHYVLIDFTARHLKGEPKAASDAKDARWVPYAELDLYKFWSETRRIIAQSARQMGMGE
jgi:8-oxo-dGTP diphosphatase